MLATLGVLLAAIDARTTWLPLPLTRLAWAAMAAAGVVLALRWARAGRACSAPRPAPPWPAALPGRLAGSPAAGSASATCASPRWSAPPRPPHSWSLLVWALLLGSVLGAAYGGLRLVRRRAGPFPYAPAMLAGAYLACVDRLGRLTGALAPST